MDVVIRRATAADVPRLHVLVESAYRGESAKRGWSHEADLLGGQRSDPEGLAALIADSHVVLLVAERGDSLIGSVEVKSEGEGVCYLGLLAVDPELQAEGLGKRLIASAERCAVETFQAKRMRMTVIKQRQALIAYYLRRGYADTGVEEPFPLDDPRFGLPKTRDLAFVVLDKDLAHSADGQAP